MNAVRTLPLLLAAALIPATASADYLGILKLPRTLLQAAQALPQEPETLGAYSFASTLQSPFTQSTALDNAYELKLGYKYSRFLSVEGQFNDVTRAQDPFSTSATMRPSFHGSGFGVDTVASLPVWRFSFYGRFGAYHGDPRAALSAYTSAGNPYAGDGRANHLRYGLGMRFNVTRSLGVVAEMDRYAPLGSPFAGEPESDLFSVGVKWHF